MKNTEFNNYRSLRLLLSIEGLGNNRINNLIKVFPEADKVLNASIRELCSVEGFYEALALKIKSFNPDPNLEDKIKLDYEKTLSHQCHILCINDDDFPYYLKNIYSPPIILYINGNIEVTDEQSVSVVGTRNCTQYGRFITDFFTDGLANNNLTIVSGMARGIDSVAHSTSIRKQNRTIAFIGCGLDIIYPPENRKLYQLITENGAVISEFEPGTPPDAVNFPKRNRLISGFSLGTLVVETRIKGGAMQTAALAIDQNKEVFAVPGNINNHFSEGTNYLIQRGEAKLVTKPEDIIEELQINNTRKQVKTKPISLTFFEEKILSCFPDEPIHIDQIAKLCSISSSECLVTLLNLEFSGIIKQLPGKMFVKSL